MTLDGVQISLLRNEVGLPQQPRMPVGRPALVHDLRRKHRIEVKRLLAHRQKDVALPALHLGRVVGDEPEQIPLRMRRYRRPLLDFQARGRGGRIQRCKALAEFAIDQRLCLRLVLRIAWAPQRAVDVDVLLESERGVEHCLDSLRPVGFDGLLNLASVTRRVLDDVLANLLLATTEQQIVA